MNISLPRKKCRPDLYFFVDARKKAVKSIVFKFWRHPFVVKKHPKTAKLISTTSLVLLAFYSPISQINDISGQPGFRFD